VPESSNSYTLRKFVPYEPKDNEEYMNEAQLDHFKNLLLSWKRESSPNGDTLCRL